MSWIALTITDVNTRLAGGEVTAVQTAAKAAGQSDPVLDIISGVVNELRGRLRNRTQLEAGAKIPEGWAPHALAIIRYRLCSRLPAKSLMTPAREQEYRDALDAFKELGAILPEIPVVVDTAVTQNAVPMLTTRTSIMDRDAQDGL